MKNAESSFPREVNVFNTAGAIFEALLGIFLVFLHSDTLYGAQLTPTLEHQGIDDVFIMLAAWHRTEKSLDIPRRVAEMVQTFAIYSVVASIICYLYQLILFPAILTLTAHNEYKKVDDECSSTCLPEELTPIKHAGVFHDRAWKYMARVVGKPWMRILTILVLIVYWSVTYYGISIVETDLSVQKLAPPDARIVKFKIRYDQAIKMLMIQIKGMQTFAVVVTTPGDLRDANRLTAVKSMIKDYETASYSYGPASTFCFLQPYLDYLTFREGEEEDEEWRGISRKYPELGVYAYTERSTFADQTDALGDVIWQTLYSEVICMGLSFIIFIPDVVSIVAAMFSLLSVNLGVFGFLSLWGVGIDPVSMAALLMSIGFSVDISAHISYHYYQVKAQTPVEKLEDAFLNIGWPTMQGGLSTMFAMMPVLIKPCYLGMVFLKTVALVTVFGLVHGLIVLPVFLSMLTALRQKCSRNTIAPADNDGSESGGSTCSVQPHRISIKSFTAYKADH
ncbi:patched family protein [Necator americanus]|uniref:Patched family protein n=1 Tax=Necator americanus TaxID=51031 RepID=W2T2N7_NECAM|nr:patched family protein [Necator americanus]ETN75506.1 patched family protein [Necator americanus]